MDKYKIMIVEDDQDLRLALQIRLRSSGYDVIVAGDAVQACIQARKEQPDLLILDIGLPGGNGIDLIKRLRPLVPMAQAIVLTARDPADFEQAARAAGAIDFFQKPVDNDDLLSAIRRALSGDTEAD